MCNLEGNGGIAPTRGTGTRRWYLRLNLGLLIVLGLLAAACRGAPPSPTPATPAQGQPTAGAASHIAASPQPLGSVAKPIGAYGSLVVSQAVSDGPGWVVITAASGQGPGTILGYAPVDSGTTDNVSVTVDLTNITANVYAVLYEDAPPVGVFNAPNGPDVPVELNGQDVAQLFSLQLASGQTTVEQKNIQFVPKVIGVTPGTTVAWVDKDSIVHTATSVSGVWDSGYMQPGQVYSYTFTAEGVFPYYCVIHGTPAGAGMAGTVVVLK